MYGNDIVLLAAGGTHTITPTIPFTDSFRITGSVTLVGNIVLQYDPTFTPVKYDLICFSWEATVTLGTSTVTIFGTTLTKEQCFGKGFIHCMYNGSSWDVRYYTSITDKATGIGSGATTTVLTNGGGTITMDITKNDNTLVLTGSPTLSSSWTVVAGGTPRAGDMQICHYKATATVGANTITILGQLLSTEQALAGNSIVISSYDGSLWRSILLDPPTPAPAAVWEVGAGILSAQIVGGGCNASGENSVALGLASVSSGQYSFATGSSTAATGPDSVAEGFTTQATAQAAHAEGYQTAATGQASHAQGLGCISSATASHAQGNTSVAHLHSSSAFSSGMFTILGDCEELKLFLKKATTNAVAANMLLGDGATTGIEIPTDSTVDFHVRYVALVTGGVAGTPGDTMVQEQKFSVQNLADTLTLLTQTQATTAGITTVAGNIIKYDAGSIGGLACDLTPTISGTKVLFQVTGVADTDINHGCLINMVIMGYNNFSI